LGWEDETAAQEYFFLPLTLYLHPKNQQPGETKIQNEKEIQLKPTHINLSAGDLNSWLTSKKNRGKSFSFLEPARSPISGFLGF
jgi:hypothetical protein